MGPESMGVVRVSNERFICAVEVRISKVTTTPVTVGNDVA